MKHKLIKSVFAFVFTGAAILGVATAPVEAREKAPKKCNKRNARPANPHGSTFMPVIPKMPTSLLSNDIIRQHRLPKKNRAKNSANKEKR